MSVVENYAEIHARPGEDVLTFYSRCTDVARDIRGTVYGTHSDTRVAVKLEMLATEAARQWAEQRK
jgi:hypothetical protein